MGAAIGFLGAGTTVAVLLGGSETPTRALVATVTGLLSLAGISVSSLSDNLFVLHVHCEDNKQKVGALACSSPATSGSGKGTKSRRSSWRGRGRTHGDVSVTNLVPALGGLPLPFSCAHGCVSPVAHAPTGVVLPLAPLMRPSRN